MGEGSGGVKHTVKMWIGNYDGRRKGLVIAPTKKRAMEIIGNNRTDFENYWTLQPEIDGTLEVEVLYTRKFDGKGSWQKGRCLL